MISLGGTPVPGAGIANPALSSSGFRGLSSQREGEPGQIPASENPSSTEFRELGTPRMGAARYSHQDNDQEVGEGRDGDDPDGNGLEHVPAELPPEGGKRVSI